jgi:maleate isomerase
MIDDVPRCCTELSQGNMDVYAFGCTSGSFYGGVGYDEKIIRIMVESTGKPATTASTAALETFQHLGVKRIAIVTPYEEWLNVLAEKFFQDNGIEVVSIIGLGLADPEGQAGQEPDTIFDFALKANRPEAEAIFISCTDFRGAEVLDRIEGELGKPAVSANQAIMWKMLNICGYYKGKLGFGGLLAELT